MLFWGKYFLLIGFILTNSMDVLAAFPEESIYNLSSKILNSEGRETSLSELSGQPVVISMAYTQCTHTCPLILSQMQQIEKDLQDAKKSDAAFVLVSFDTKNDTPQNLKKYFEKKKFSKRWHLYTAKSDGPLREIANVLGIKYKKIEDGYFDHSFIITVLDAQGMILGQQIGADKNPKDLVKLLIK